MDRDSGGMDVLRALLYGLTAQRPAHSVFIADVQLPMEARIGGIFLGFLGAWLYVRVLGRTRAGLMPPTPTSLACAGLVLLTILDGANATLADASRAHLYPPQLSLRLLTGIGAGWGLGLLALPVIASQVWQHTEQAPPVEDLVEMGYGLTAALSIGVVALMDVGPLLWPLALAMASGVLVAFTLANLLWIVVATHRMGRAERWRDLASPTVAAVGLTLLELVAFGWVRAWVV